MHRRRFATLVAGTCLSGPFAARAQAAKSFRIGLLHAFAEPTPRTKEEVEALRSGLRELGWIEGKNLAIESRYAGLGAQRQREAAAELRA
jgi:putative ABC transport system substrate-binding protein